MYYSGDKTISEHKSDMLDEYTRLHYKHIDGGTVYYTEDIREIVNLNNRLEEAQVHQI